MKGKTRFRLGTGIVGLLWLTACQARSPLVAPADPPPAIATDPAPSPSPSASALASPEPLERWESRDRSPQWIEPGTVQTQTMTTAIGNVTSLQAELRLGFGQLKVAAGGDRAVDSQFRYNRDEWKPSVDYTRTGDRGNLVITQPQFPASGDSFVMQGNFVNEWQLQLPSRLPVDLTLDAGALEGRLDLSAIALENLHLRAGSGNLAVQTGTQKMGQLRLNVGAGDVALNVPGGQLETLEVETGAGNIELDLRGNWQASLRAVLRGNGNVVLFVPTDVGVQVETAGMGLVQGDGLSESGAGWVNSAYGRSPVTLTIQHQGMGIITVATR